MTESQYQELVEFLGGKFGRIDRRFDGIEDRLARVEVSVEENRHQLQVVAEGVTTLRSEMDRRFDEVDVRLEQVDRRFEQVDLRFEQVDRRFEQVDHRFEQVDLRFAQVDRRFDAMDERFDGTHELIRSFHPGSSTP